MDAVEMVKKLGGKIADFDDPKCVLCTKNPCQCPPFGTPEYFALTNKAHGK